MLRVIVLASALALVKALDTQARDHNPVSLQERVVYNRIGKAGSSFIISALAALSKTNHFILTLAGSPPSKAVLAQELGNLRNNTVWVSHSAFLNGTRDLKWINVVREPIARWSSLFWAQGLRRGRCNGNVTVM